jgi:hypothetical protein
VIKEYTMIVSQPYHNRTIEQPSTRTITIQHTTAASLLIQYAQPDNLSLHRALHKAEMRLLTQPWRLDAGVLHIVSHSRQNEVHVCDGEDCSCEATRGVCWHIASWTILSTLAAAGSSLRANLPLPAVVDVDELPGSFLDGPFDWADDLELTMPYERAA